MNTKKILFLDLDDTLLNRRKEISNGNNEAIQKALREGHLVVINSGRPLIGVTPLLNHLGLTRPGCYAIAYNGGLIYDSYEKKVIFQQTLSFPDVKHIFNKAAEFGLHCQTYDSRHLIAPAHNSRLQYYVDTTHVPYRIDPGCPDTLTEAPCKVLTIGETDRKSSEAYLQSMRDWAEGRIDMFYSSQLYIEHVPIGVSKGNAILKLCELLDIPVENTIAVGDAENDAAMLKAAHTGVAVANAIPELKELADYVTKNDCDHDAIAEVIYKFILSFSEN